MSPRPVRLRAHAATDIDEAVDHYLSEAGIDAASRFVDAIERTVNQISHTPQSGSLRFAYELEIPDLRVCTVARSPHLVFYVMSDEAVDFWRVVHSRRDIPSLLSDTSDD